MFDGRPEIINSSKKLGKLIYTSLGLGLCLVIFGNYLNWLKDKNELPEWIPLNIINLSGYLGILLITAILNFFVLRLLCYNYNCKRKNIDKYYYIGYPGTLNHSDNYNTAFVLNVPFLALSIVIFLISLPLIFKTIFV
jgi:hypothetical protein